MLPEEVLRAEALKVKRALVLSGERRQQRTVTFTCGSQALNSHAGAVRPAVPEAGHCGCRYVCVRRPDRLLLWRCNKFVLGP